MPMSRWAAGTGEMSLPSTMTEPVSAVSKPATMRSAVVLPQPEGPSKATSSPGAILMDSPSRARMTPNARVRSRSSTLVPPPARTGPVPAAVVAASRVVLVVISLPAFRYVRR